MSPPSAVSSASQHIALSAGFSLKPPLFLGDATLTDGLRVGSLQQRLRLHFPEFSGPRMKPYVFCDTTKLALGQFQEEFRIPRADSICAPSWEALFRNRVTTSLLTLRPTLASGTKWILLTSPSLAPLAVPVTHANPLLFTSWEVSLPTGVGSDTEDESGWKLDADWNDAMDGFDVTYGFSRDSLKVYGKLGFSADSVIPNVVGSQPPDLAGGVELDVSKLSGLRALPNLKLTTEFGADSVEFDAAISREIFHLNVELKGVVKFEQFKNVTPGLFLNITLPEKK